MTLVCREKLRTSLCQAALEATLYQKILGARRGAGYYTLKFGRQKPLLFYPHCYRA